MATKLYENRKLACVFVKPSGHNTLGISGTLKISIFPHGIFKMNWLLDGHLLKLGPLYTRSQGQKILGPTLSIFELHIGPPSGFFFGPKLLINARTLM
jgi:hypothetical protein